MSKSEILSIRKELNKFINLSKITAKSHPFITVILMHEYFRTIYPYDPFIKKRYAKNNSTNILLCLKNNNSILNLYKNTGSYFNSASSISNHLSNFENKKTFKTQELFGQLWQERFKNNLLNSRKVLVDSFRRNNFDIKYLKNKSILDIGCGSGRFSIALASFSAKKVIGLDLGDEGIKIARKVSKSNNIKNVKFVKGSALELPFKDNSFDFVFCKGVLHHTGNLQKGLKEYYRVMKKNGMGFLYLYGSGGIFWESRKKMRRVMSLIPLQYTIKVLDLIGMPSRRSIFTDSWYVPIEEHCKTDEIENIFKKLGYQNFKRWKKGRRIELESMVFGDNAESSELLWGNGELRYILKK